MTLDSYSFVAIVGWGREWLLILGCVQVHQWELSCSLMYFFFEASSGIHDWGFFFFSFLAVSHVMWDLSPRPGIKLMPPAAESTTGSPGKSLDWLFFFLMADNYLSVPRSLSKVSWQKKARRTLNGFQPVTLILIWIGLCRHLSLDFQGEYET